MSKLSLSRSTAMRSSSNERRHNESYITRLSKSSRSPVRERSKELKDEYKEYQALYNA